MPQDARFARLETLFQQAMDLPPADRRAFVAAQCADDPELRARLEGMLAKADTRSLGAAAPAIAQGPLGVLAEAPGAVIDRYKLLQVIGEGGFGVVYMAEQQEPVRRQVALKVLKLGMDTAEVVARFEAERQALAMMDHDGIAKILDGGTTSSGRPYFVMELVRGVSITDYCDRNGLPTRQRLELLAAVCDAVQHAHQKGVIHRDLKPSNIMVTLLDGRPVPKVIDFGIVKAIHTKLTERTLFTRYERFIGTPAYMSPEQAELSALDVDTRTDIYALGAVLYEMLTGTPPFDVEELMRAGLGEIQRVIREQPPQRPSARVSTHGDAAICRSRGAAPVELSRKLRGDLDWIVMKALEKERVRRYDSASELAADLRRHLERRPVSAGPPSRLYLLTKFVARNRGAVAAAVVVVLALLGGVLGVLWAKAEADRRRDDAEVSLGFLAQTLALADPDVAREPDLSVRTLLDRASAKVGAAFAGRPEAEARVRSVIGRAYKSIGANEAAERHLRRVAGLLEEQPVLDGAEAWNTLWALTNVAFRLERDDSYALSQVALRAAHEHVGVTDAGLGRLLAQFNAAFLAQDLDRAAELFGETQRRAAAVLTEDDPLWPVLADCYKAAGFSVWFGEHEHLAAEFWAEALRIKERVLPANHPDIGETLTLLVGVLQRSGRAAEAEERIRASLRLLREVYPARHWQIALAESALAESLFRRGEFEQAEALLVPAYAVVREIWDESNYNTMEVLGRLISLYDGWQRPEMAQPYREVLARTTATYKWLMPWAYTRLVFSAPHAELCSALDRLNQACGGLRYTASPPPVAGAAVAGPVARVRAQRQRDVPPDSEAAATIARVLLLWSDAVVLGDDGVRGEMVAEAAGILAHWPSLQLERIEAAIKQAELRAAEDPDAARALARQALAELDDVRARNTGWIAGIRVTVIARIVAGLGLFAEAEPLLLDTLQAMTSQMGSDQEHVHSTRAALHDLYVAWGRPERARAFAPTEPDSNR